MFLSSPTPFHFFKLLHLSLLSQFEYFETENIFNFYLQRLVQWIMHCSEADNNGKAVVNGNKEGMVSLDSLNTNQDLVATDDTDHTFHRHKLKSSSRH